MVSVRANVSSSSPSYHYGSSPVSLSCLLEQPHNQCVPSSPSLSPFFRHAALSQKLLSRSSGSPAAAQVPDSTERAGMTASQGTLGSGNRVYSGSPLLRQILRVGRKRQFEGEGGSPLRVSASTTPSPIAQSSKRAKLESPGMCVPSSVIIIERNSTRRKPRGSEQVVPGAGSPLEVAARQRGPSHAEDKPRGWLNDCQRSLPKDKKGVKPLDLFSGDEIFANHEE